MLSPQEFQKLKGILGSTKTTGFSSQIKSSNLTSRIWNNLASKQRAEKFAGEAQAAEAEAQRLASPLGQAKEFGKAVGEITGFTPTGRKIAAAIAPYTETAEDLQTVVNELAGGVTSERRMGEVGNFLKKMGANENVAEWIDIALDLPVISLGLSKTISTALEKEVVQKSPELLKFLAKPLTEFAPNTLKNILKTDITTPIKESVEGLGKGVRAIVEKPSEYVASRFPKLLGIFTGEDIDIIRVALKEPEIADIGIRGGDEALRRAVNTGAQKSVQLRDSFIKGHSEAFRVLAGENTGKLVKKSQIWNGFYGALGEDVKIGTKGELDFTTSQIKANPGEITKINDVMESLKKWDDFSLAGLNKLKQLVGKLTRFPSEAGGVSKSPVLGKFYNNLDNLIKENLPEESKIAYTEMNKNFTESIELYEDIIDAFNSGDPFVKLSNAFSKNKDTLRQVLEFYEKESGEKVLPIVAGRELAAERKAAFGFLNPRSWIDLLISPEIQAKVVTGLGRLKKK